MEVELQEAPNSSVQKSNRFDQGWPGAAMAHVSRLSRPERSGGHDAYAHDEGTGEGQDWHEWQCRVSLAL